MAWAKHAIAIIVKNVLWCQLERERQKIALLRGFLELVNIYLNLLYVQNCFSNNISCLLLL